MGKYTQIFQGVRDASFSINGISNEQINQILKDIADEIVKNSDYILAENLKDLNRMDPLNPMYDRLKLTKERIECIAEDIIKVSTLPSPLGRILKHIILPNGLDLTRISVPFGVIGVVYEARPNVTLDVFTLSLKSGNACVLKGGKDSDDSNKAIVGIIKKVLIRHEVNPHIVELLPATHEAVKEMLHANEFIDLVIPRGSNRLIKFVRDEASVPVIETGAGVCHAYFDKDGDLMKGVAIIHNAKTRRVSVCNALDSVLVHKDRLSDLCALCEPLQKFNVKIYADNLAFSVLNDHYPEKLLLHASEDSYGKEYQSYAMSLKIVMSEDEAILHIRKYGSGHSESIITENIDTEIKFFNQIDAACVYCNAPTSFTDGAQFGLGAEIGISTQKLHARGPMALEEMTTYKWIIIGNGQVRE